jgi:SAM-dependent methyltransferase
VSSPHSAEAIALYPQVLDRLRRLADAGDRPGLHEALWRDWMALHHYLSSFRLDDAGPEVLAPYVNDALPRFLHTLDRLPLTPGLRVLELGGNPYLFTLLLQRLLRYQISLANFTHANIYETAVGRSSQRVWSEHYGEDHTFAYDSFNLELSDYPYPEESFDLVLFCEILEHLVVDPLKIFAKLRRIIRPGGLLLITTPNAVRLVNVALILSGSNIFDRYHPQNGVYGRHNREFTIPEMDQILRGAGFRPVILETLDRHDYSRTPILSDGYDPVARIRFTKPVVEAALRLLNAPTEHRGDNIYALAERTDEPYV